MAATTYIFGPYLQWFGAAGLAPGDSWGFSGYGFSSNDGQLIRDNFTVTVTGHPGTGLPDQLGTQRVVQTLTISDLGVQNVPEPWLDFTGRPTILYHPNILFTARNSGSNTIRDCEFYLTFVQKD